MQRKNDEEPKNRSDVLTSFVAIVSCRTWHSARSTPLQLLLRSAHRTVALQIGFATLRLSSRPVTGSRISRQLTASSRLPSPSSAFPNSTPSSFRAVLR